MIIYMPSHRPTLLTGAQFRTLIRRLELSSTDLALLTGAAPSTVYEWGRRASVPGPVSTLMLLFQANPDLIKLALSLVLRTAPYMLPPELLNVDGVIAGAEALVTKFAPPTAYRTLAEAQAEADARKGQGQGQGQGQDPGPNPTLPPGKTGPFD